VSTSKTDLFANLAILTVTESAANTLTFKKLETGISVNQKIAWVVSRIEYFLSSLVAAQFNGDGDAISWGICASSTFANAIIEENSILDFNNYQRADYGAAAVSIFHKQPFLKDFASMPSGGIIVPPAPLFGFVKGSGLVSAMTVAARIYYTELELAESDFWQLVQARRPLTS
jgi:hypothetical protein